MRCGAFSRAQKRGIPPCMRAPRVVALSCAAARRLFHLNDLPSVHPAIQEGCEKTKC